MHPILKQLVENYRLAVEKQIEQYAGDALANIAICETEIEDANARNEHKKKYDYYALIISSQDGIFVSPVAAVEYHPDEKITGWICVLRNYIETFASVCASYPDDELRNGLAEITAGSAASRIYNDEIYDQDYEFDDAEALQGGTALVRVEFALSDRFELRSAIAYEYLQLDNAETTWREYWCSYIIITGSELAGIYSSVDL